MLLEIHVNFGDRPNRMNFIREHFPYGANDHIVGFDFVQNVVRIHLEEKPDYEQSLWLLHERDDEEIITSFQITDDAPHAEPPADLLYQDESRRVVLIHCEYKLHVCDLTLELDELGYTSNLLYRDGDIAARIPLRSANAKKIVTELEAWEKEHGDANPF